MTKGTVIAEIGLLVVYLIAANPAVTGVSLHEWVGLAVLVALLVHGGAALGHSAVGRAGGPSSVRRAVALGLTGALLLASAVCAVSGVMISGAVLPAFGYYAHGYFFWGPVHALAAKVLLVLIVIHLALQLRKVRAFVWAHRRCA